LRFVYTISSKSACRSLPSVGKHKPTGGDFAVQELQFIECVAERDIDLLLLEEYHVSASFRSWLIGQAFEPDFCCG